MMSAAAMNSTNASSLADIAESFYKSDVVYGFTVFRAVLWMGLGAPTVVINSFILRGLVLATELPRPCRTLLVNMACCDFLSGLTMMGNAVLFVRPEQTTSAQCSGGTGVQASLALVSILLSTLFPVNAYLSQLIPFRYRGVMCPIKVSLTSLAVWTISVVLVFVALQDRTPEVRACDIVFLFHPVALRSFAGIYLVCLAVMSGVFWKLYTLARSHICKIVSQTHHEQKSAVNVSLQAKALKTVSQIAASFALMYTPLALYLLIASFQTPQDVLTLGHFLTQLCFLTLFLAKSVVNPLVYAWKIPFVRDVTHKLFRRFVKERLDISVNQSVTEKTTRVV